MALEQTKFYKSLICKAKKLHKTIVLPEAEYSDRVLAAALACVQKGVANVVLLAKSNALDKYANGDKVRVVNIATSDLKPMLASALQVKRANKGMTIEEASALVENEIYFAAMMVELGLADGYVAGAETSTQNVLKPALQIIKGATPDSLVSSVIFMIKDSTVFAMSDCGINLEPSAEEIVQIAKQTALSVKKYMGTEPKVALLSYSTNGSGKGDSALKMHNAKLMLDSENVSFDYDGEMQLDAAVDLFTRKVKYPTCKLKGVANAFVFPNLDSGNIGYKLVARFGGYAAVGPLTQGLRKPVNDISRGATTEEIVLIIAATAIEGEDK